MCEDLEDKCSLILVDKCLVVSPMYLALQPGQEKRYTTKDLRAEFNLSFAENKEPILKVEKLKRTMLLLQKSLAILLNLFIVRSDVSSIYGNWHLFKAHM